MKSKRKINAIILIVILLLQFGAFSPAYADVNPPQPAPEMLRLNDASETPIGYNEFDKYYIDLKWNPLQVPAIADNAYINFYLQEINKPYKPSKPLVVKEPNVPGSETELRMKNLNSGTIYHTYARAYYTYTDGTTTYTSPESVQSNTVRFLTDIAIDAYSYGNKQIKIEWDDVWNSGRRIDYKLYVSENKDFASTPPIYINQELIGANGPVKVNEATGKLEYIHTVRDPGRVYYIKIAPDIADTELKRSAESRTIAVSSYILARTSKLFTTDFGTIWRLDWSRVVTGLGDSNIKVSYQIYKGTAGSQSVPQYMAAVDDTTFFVTLQPGEENAYFIIRAIVTRNGEDVYPGIKIESDKIFVKESEVPSYPPAPELVDEFADAGISYEGELTSNSATILWRAPRKGNGEVDTDTTYDIWLISDPNQIDNPPDTAKIASSLAMTESNQVRSGNILLGYKYKLADLTPNSTYYFKIVAKKTFIVFSGDTLESVEYSSQPALKLVITPTEGPIDQPLVPARPPLQIKKTPPPESKDMVTETTAVIQLKNKWYEQFVDGKWVYKTVAELGTDLVEDIENGTADPMEYRIVAYDNGVTIDVGCIEYRDGMVLNDLKTIPANKVMGFPVTANDPNEDPEQNPDGLKHNVDITLTNLLPNTTYIIWVRAARRSTDLISGPSDPIVITTNPDIEEPLEKPTVPIFNYYNAGDTYVDLGWNFKTGYTYYIKYGKIDVIDSAQGNATVTPEDLRYSNYYRITGLEPGTLYYFWIQAEATNASGNSSKSEWSDSYLVKTLPYQPPATPRGFGIKTSEDAVTKNSITYEWIAEDGMEYILEVASDIDYKDAKEYKAGGVSEYTVSGLRSNYRYYARLYAYDKEKDLKSAPTQSVTVRTKRSSDDYDSDEDIENVVSGDYIVKDTIITNNTWTISLVGVNADRFVEHIRNDRVLDYRIDLTVPPAGAKKISLIISGKVFDALTALKENLMIANPKNILVIRPGVFSGSGRSASGKSGDIYFEILIELERSVSDLNTGNVTLKTPVTAISVNTYEGANSRPVGTFSKPLKVLYNYTSSSWYKEGTTAGYVYDESAATWTKARTTASYDTDNSRGQLSFETLKPGSFAVGEPGGNYFDDIGRHWARNSINKVASLHKLNSIAGRKFEPDKFTSKAEAVKFMLDVLDYSYDSSFMNYAVRAGIIAPGDMENPDAECTREKVISMAVRVYELKSGEKATPSESSSGMFDDMNRVSGSLLSRVRFAAENGLIISRFERTLGPGDPVTRAEVMVLLEKVMAFVGEVE